MSDQEEYQYYSLPSLMTPEDIKQENALRELEGLRPRAFRVSGVTYREIGYGLYLPGSLDVAFEDRRAPSFETVARLMDWVHQQSEGLQEVVFAYLDNPSDFLLKVIMKEIGRDKPPPEPEFKDSTLTALVLRSLPTTIDKLYVLARREHSAKRPEANIRQILRRMTRNGQVALVGDTYYRSES